MTQELYTQLRLALLEPGEEWRGYRRPYAPVNKDNWTFDYAMTQPDTPNIAALRLNGKLSWLLMGKHRQAVA